MMKTTSYLAIAAAASLVLGGMVMAPKAARAADLGGDCCADLEKRVADLEATTITKGNRKVSFEISGRLAYTVTYFTDNSSPPAKAGNGSAPVTTDSKSDLYVTDNSGNGPAFFFDGKGSINKDTVVGFHQEIDYDMAGSNSQNTRQSGQSIGFGQSYVYISSMQLGKVEIGDIHGVFDDFGGEGFATAYMAGLQGSLRGVNAFFLRDSAGKSSTLTYSSDMVNSGLDDSTDGGVKYISPVIGKWLTVEGAYNGDATWTFGGSISGNVTKSVAIKGGIAYMTSNEGDALTGGKANPGNVNGQERRLAFSGGFNDTDSGLFGSGDYAIAYADGNAAPSAVTGLTNLQDISVWELLGGWHKNVNGMGTTELWGSYVKATNGLSDGSSGQAFQLGVDQAIDSASAHVFLTFENDSASLPAGTKDVAGNTIPNQNLSTIIGGVGITF